MLYIDPLSPNIFAAKQTHQRFLTCFVHKKIGGKPCGDNDCVICKSSREFAKPLDDRIKKFLLSSGNLDKILSGIPGVLEQVNIDFWKILFKNHTAADLTPYFRKVHPRSLAKKEDKFRRNYKIVQYYVTQLKQIFDYRWFSSSDTVPYNAYHLCKTLDRYTCTYCNRSYTSTVFHDKTTPVIRPTLDHWFPKSEYPLLSVSFFNLVPSCYPCNSSVKGATALTTAKNIHPYVDAGQTDDFEFDYTYTALDGFRILVNDTPSGVTNKSRAKNTVQSMHLEDIYSSNISELRDLLIIKRNYSTSYLATMQGLLKTKMSKSEVYRILFGVMYEQENFHKRPLSKFKRDILKKLGMLDDMP